MAVPVYRDRSSSHFALLTLCLAVVGASAILYYQVGLFLPRSQEVRETRKLGGGYAFADDLYQIWVTSLEWQQHRSDPYSAEMTREIQSGLYGRPLDPNRPGDPKDLRMFPYPAFADILFWPVAELPFVVARVVFVCLLVLLTAASVWLWMQALGLRFSRHWMVILLLLVFGSFPVLEGLYAGQVGLLVACLLAASILALQRGKSLLSGVLMALTTIKPQVTLLAILYLLFWSSSHWRRGCRFCAGFFATLLLLVGAALAVWPHWIQSWTHVVLLYHGYNAPPLLTTVVDLLLGRGTTGSVSQGLTAALLIVAAILAWRNRSAASDSLEFWFTLSLLLAVTTIALLPGQAIYDHVILLPGILMLASRWRQWSANWVLRALLTIGVGMLVWPWIASVILIGLHPFLTHEQFYSKPIFSLPLHVAYVFPFVVLGVLTLAARSQKLTRETIEFSVSR
jgi:hypothetical protein